MDAESAIRLFQIYVVNSVRILNEGFGVDRAESNFFDAIALAKEHPSVRESAIEAMRLELQNTSAASIEVGQFPKELMELFAHETRWEELRALAVARIRDRFGGDMSAAAGDVAVHIIGALSDDWEDREFYQRYAAD